MYTITEKELMKWIKIILIWCCMIPIAIINGGFREYVLEKFLSLQYALPISGIVLSGLIYIIARLLLPSIRDLSKGDCILTGILWVILTVSFEFYFGLSSGTTWKELLKAYNPFTGNLWIMVVIITLISPMLVCRKQLRQKPH